MRIQLLTFPGCPNAEGAREALRRSIAAVDLPPGFEEVDVTDPATPDDLRNWGSPTILVDGRDVTGGAPTGTSCRLYPKSADGRRVPPDEVIRGALDKRRRRGWLRSVALLPGALLALLPAATCPVCLGAYFSVLSALGLGFLANERIVAPLIAALLALGVFGVVRSTRRHRRVGPLVVTVVGSAAVVAGRLAANIPALLYPGVALLLAGSLWNLWLQRPRSISSRRSQT